MRERRNGANNDTKLLSKYGGGGGGGDDPERVNTFMSKYVKDESKHDGKK